MNRSTIVAISLGGVLIAGVATAGTALAMDSSHAPASVSVTAPKATPAPAKTIIIRPKAPASGPSVTINNNVPAPQSTTYVPVPAQDPSGLRYVADGVYANGNTSDAFALSVHQAYVDGGYWNQSGTSSFWAYSTVTGQSYWMTSSSVGDPVVVTGANGVVVQFNM